MIKDDFNSLEWDSSFLGISTGIINRRRLTKEELENILLKMKLLGFKLVYFPSVNKIDEISCKQFKGILADEKVILLKNIEENYNANTDRHIISYTQKIVTPALLELAWESGIYSRFNVDPNFKNNEYKHLYKTWIEKSVNKEIAKDVLVYIDEDITCGMITLGEKNKRGDIGLLAVSNAARGKGIGKKLMIAAENYFREKGYDQLQVVTQGANKAALNLYQSCGFHIEDRSYFYHFWL